MSENPHQQTEARLIAIARAFPYPPTPDISQAVMRRLAEFPSLPRHSPRARRLAWAAVGLLLLMSALMAVPPVRAQILEFIQMGVVRILLAQPALSLTPSPSPSGRGGISTTHSTSPTRSAEGSGGKATPLPAVEGTGVRENTPPAASLLDFAGKTTLAEAQSKINFPILLPAYPEGVGLPDAVFLQDLGGQVLILVWMNPEQPDRIWFSLHELGPGGYSMEKIQPQILEYTTVHGQPAIWTTGPYLVMLRNNNLDLRRLIEGHVLIWTEGEITYRLETDLSLEEATRMAESMKPAPSIPATPLP